MNLFRLLIKSKRWLRHPPSKRQMAWVFGAIAVSLCLAGIEYFWGWPEALRLQGWSGRIPLQR